MQSSRATVAIAAAIFFFFFTPLLAQDPVEALIGDAGLREGSVPMRDIDGWDRSRKIVIRDIGLDMSRITERFGGADIVVVSSYEEATAQTADAGAIIGYCDAELLGAAPHVTWVQIYSAGAEHCLSNDGSRRDNIVLTNMQKMSSPVIAEHAIALLLALTRNLPEFIDGSQQGAWQRDEKHTTGMTTIEGKTMLVLGLGGIGSEIARRAAALGMRVVATRNSSRKGPEFVDYVGLSNETLDLARNADVIVNSLPLTPATRGLLDSDFFAAGSARRPYFINVGRGGTVDTAALLDALRTGKLAGAGLDVTDPEPLPPQHALWQQENVIITPHISSTGNDYSRQMLLATENIRRYLAGAPLLNVVDPDKGY